MFNRRDPNASDRAQERAGGNARVPGEPQRTVMPSMPAMQYSGAMPEPPSDPSVYTQSEVEPVSQPNETVIAREDTFEGQLRTSRGVRILGTVRGSIESASFVHIEPNAVVEADISATEVVIGGDYSGNLNCRQRVEIQSTGRVRGRLDTVKLHLHEGGYFDGELHMQKPPEMNERRSFGSGGESRVRRPRFTDVAPEQTPRDNSNREINSAEPSA